MHFNNNNKKYWKKKSRKANIKAQEIGLENFVDQKNKNLNNKNKNLASFISFQYQLSFVLTKTKLEPFFFYKKE